MLSPVFYKIAYVREKSEICHCVTTESKTTPNMTSDSENSLYESDFDASSNTDFEEINDQNIEDQTIDETKYFEESQQLDTPQSESLLHPKDQTFSNSVAYQSPAKPHETSSIFEALECLRIEL